MSPGASALPSGLRKILAEDGQRASRERTLWQRVGHVVRDRQAFARELDRGRQQLREAEPAGAVARMREREPRDRAGHADAERGIAGLARVGVRRSRQGKCRAWSPPARSRDSRSRRRLAAGDGGSPCSRRRRYCRRADRSPPARSRSRPRRRPRCRPFSRNSTPMRAAGASCATTMPWRAVTCANPLETPANARGRQQRSGG